MVALTHKPTKERTVHTSTVVVSKYQVTRCKNTTWCFFRLNNWTGSFIQKKNLSWPFIHLHFIKKWVFLKPVIFLSRTGHLYSCFIYHNMTFEPLFVVMCLNAWSWRRVHAGKFRHNMVMVASASERLMCYCMWPWSIGFTSLSLPSNLQQICSVHQELPGMAHQASMQ